MTERDESYVAIRGKIRAIRDQSIFFTVGDSVPRGDWIPRSLIHGGDERLIDGLRAAVQRAEKQGGVERTIRIFAWKAEQGGFITNRDQATDDLFNTAQQEMKMTSLTKTKATIPALIVTGPRQISVLAGTALGEFRFDADTPVEISPELLQPGRDYAVTVAEGKIGLAELSSAHLTDNVLGGFHFAPGGNAAGRSGGDTVPAINPYSIWDRNFRPACDDPRGMTMVDVPGKGRVWCDIYLLGKDHLDQGTSRFGATIADGTDLPQNPAGGSFKKFDYDAACAVMKHHGKQLLGAEEFFTAAYGVTERTAAPGEPKSTGLDAQRTSRWGVMQATGNMWAWGTDGHPDMPRASIFGGAWFNDDYAGSRYADLGDWPAGSDDDVGARGRSDHLQLG